MSENAPPAISVLPVQREACGHKWPEIFELPMLVESFAARLKADTQQPN